MKRNELLSKVIRMGKMVLPLYLFTFLPLSMTAQDDDMYFVPSKENKVKEAKKYDTSRDTYYSGSNRSVDEYNRRIEIINPADSTGNDIIDFSAVRGVYPDSVYTQQQDESDDYTLTRQMSRFDDYTPSAAYWDGYRAGRWSSPWYNTWYSWYDPWYYDSWWYWNDPFYYSSWYGWRSPYYYSWYSPRYYGYYGYYRPWYGSGYVSRGTGSHMSPNLRSYQRKNYYSDGSRRSGVGSRAGNVGVGSRPSRSYSSSSGVGTRSSGSYSPSSGSFSPSSGSSSRSSGSFGSSSGGSRSSGGSFGGGGGGGSRPSGGGGGGVRNSGGRR